MTARGTGAATLAGVVFDFDGVLADSEPLHLRANQDVLAQHGMSLAASDYYDRYLGFDDADVFRTVWRDHGRELDEDSLAELIRVKGERFEALAGEGVGAVPPAPPTAFAASRPRCPSPSRPAPSPPRSRRCSPPPACVVISGPSLRRATRRGRSPPPTPI